MINIFPISYINIQNEYSYIFGKNLGNGFFWGSLNKKGDGWGDGSGFGNIYGFSDGNGHSHSTKNLTRYYKTND